MFVKFEKVSFVDAGPGSGGSGGTAGAPAAPVFSAADVSPRPKPSANGGLGTIAFEIGLVKDTLYVGVDSAADLDGPIVEGQIKNPCMFIALQSNPGKFNGSVTTPKNIQGRNVTFQTAVQFQVGSAAAVRGDSIMVEMQAGNGQFVGQGTIPLDAAIGFGSLNLTLRPKGDAAAWSKSSATSGSLKRNVDTAAAAAAAAARAEMHQKEKAERQRLVQAQQQQQQQEEDADAAQAEQARAQQQKQGQEQAAEQSRAERAAAAAAAAEDDDQLQVEAAQAVQRDQEAALQQHQREQDAAAAAAAAATAATIAATARNATADVQSFVPQQQQQLATPPNTVMASAPSVAFAAPVPTPAFEAPNIHGVVLRGWFLKAPEKRGKAKRRFLELIFTNGNTAIVEYFEKAAANANGMVSGVKSKGTFEIGGTSGIAFGNGDGKLVITNMDRVWKLTAESPGQETQWGKLLRAVASDYAAVRDPKARYAVLAASGAASNDADLAAAMTLSKKDQKAAAKAAAKAAKKKVGGMPRKFQFADVGDGSSA